MKRRWMGAALVSLGLAGQAFSQAPYPATPSGPAPMYQPSFANDPMPMAGPQFGMPPGPMPDTPFSLPNDGSLNAFSEGCFDCFANHGCYVYLGWSSLRRYSLGNGVVAVRDIPSQGIDTGLTPPADAPVAVRFGDLSPDWMQGGRITVGYREGCNAFELSGFYVYDLNSSFEAADRGRLDLPFSAFPSPLGFQGDNFLWLQADRVVLNLETSVGSGEANYRYGHCAGLEFLFGARYLDVDERLGILTDDDGLTVSPVNPTQIANYSVRSHNRIIAGQVGFEYDHPLLSCMTVGFSGKGAWGANFTRTSSVLQRGDGVFGPSSNASDTIFSHLYEASVWGSILLTEQCRIRAGYQFLWVVHVPTVVGLVNFDPGTPGPASTEKGSIFFHGPMVEVQFKF